jgi:NADP-dependent 3-hydroxy acid dehydrogenase YdfG
MKEFEDRVAVVTGAASGIGHALSKSFLEAGMKVVMADIDEERLQITHDFNNMIEPRMKNILAAENPELLPPPQEFMEIYQELMNQSGGQ